MYSLDTIKRTIEQMSDEELAKRLRGGMFSEEARPLVEAEIERRKLDLELIQNAAVTDENVSILKQLPVLLVLLIQFFFGFVALWQILTLWPVLGWIKHADQIPFGTWMNAAVKGVVLLISALLWFVFGKLRPRVRAWTQRVR